MRVFAAEVVQKAMLRPHELDVDLTVLMATRPAIVDQELDVNPLLVHVTDASVGIPVIAVQVRSLTPHEPSRGPASCGARLSLTERARGVCSPTTNGFAAAEAKTCRVRWVIRNARRMPSLGHFPAFQVRH